MGDRFPILQYSYFQVNRPQTDLSPNLSPARREALIYPLPATKVFLFPSPLRRGLGRGRLGLRSNNSSSNTRKLL
jgi:hypothetical protein